MYLTKGEYRMKEVLVTVILVVLVSCWGSDENGNDVLILSKRDRCENTVRTTQNVLDSEDCIVGLGGSAGSTSATNLMLLLCLNYQFEMAKCKKKSDVLPP
jgi:hypothetical protein